jgi:GNAT superfamily N-acetyltransferase
MHRALRSELPFLPGRAPGDFLPRLRWLGENGVLLGLFEPGGRLRAYLGGFLIEDFRNAGPGAYAPDWGLGAAGSGGAGFDDLRLLYREAIPRYLELGARLHAVSIYASARDLLRAFALCGFGTIVLDAARPSPELSAELGDAGADPGAPAIRRAAPGDAPALARLGAALADHIGSPPVCMPRTRGEGADAWEEWLADPERVAFLSLGGKGEIVGFIKAEAPQVDVSYSVHDVKTLAINGMFLDPAFRGRGAARRLLATLVAHASEAGFSMISVDHETTNLEAMAFWSRFFRPVTYSMERRI